MASRRTAGSRHRWQSGRHLLAVLDTALLCALRLLCRDCFATDQAVASNATAPADEQAYLAGCRVIKSRFGTSKCGVCRQTIDPGGWQGRWEWLH